MGSEMCIRDSTENNPIEQVMFTNISYPEYIAPERFETPGKRINTYNTQMPKKPIIGAHKNRVEFESLPTGFSEVSETFQSMPINDGPVSHVMLSDGMASVSVYVEYVPKAEQAKIQSWHVIDGWHERVYAQSAQCVNHCCW